MCKEINTKFLLLFFFVFGCNESFAQKNNRLGLFFGLNHFSVRGSSFLDKVDSDNGYLVGLTYEYKFHKKLSVFTGIALEQKNLEYNSASSSSFVDDNFNITVIDFTTKTTNNYQYYSIPLLLRFNFGKNNSFFVDGGFFWAFTGIISRTTEITNVTENYSYNVPTQENNNFLFADDINGSDTGISFGLGKSFKLTKVTNLSIELRDNLGLKNAISNISLNGITGTIKTNTINLLCQLSFDF
jgi:hypothetical protein